MYIFGHSAKQQDNLPVKALPFCRISQAADKKRRLPEGAALTDVSSDLGEPSVKVLRLATHAGLLGAANKLFFYVRLWFFLALLQPSQSWISQETPSLSHP